MNKFLFILFFISRSLVSNEKSVCGETDDRLISSINKIGRVNDGVTSVCTVTLISKRCALSAGHCHSILNEVSFNVPPSVNGIPTPSKVSDRFVVDRYETSLANDGVGRDYAVLELLPNNLNGHYPGDKHGYLDVSFERPRVTDQVMVIGFGKDSRPSRNYSQQYHSGIISSIDRGIIGHNVDTRFGNSGSVIIHKSTNKVIGVHTHGACYSSGGSNYGTLISGNQRLKQAIKNCLARELLIP